ncbi:MAG: class I SAM-dependent methyltransferase [Chloroflexi bacterium]|nr:class I SAM-dependent methyltransferase [Chloroflexota bacterium]
MSEQVYDLSEGWNSLAAEMLYACVEQLPAAELAFYARRIRANGGPALDQACGTGRHLFALLERGLVVHGADISADALRLAQREAVQRRVPVTLYQQRMEACDLPTRYGTIYVANGTFQILADRAVALATLRRFREHLLPGGQLLLEVGVPPEVTQGAAVHDAAHPMVWDPEPRRGAAGAIVTTLWSEDVDLFRQTLLSKRRYDLYVDGRLVRSETHAHVLTWFCYHEMVGLLERAGYKEITTYGDWSDEPATQASQTVVYGARQGAARTP